MLWGCNSSKMAWPPARHWMVLSPDSWHVPSVTTCGRWQRVSAEKTWHFSIPTTFPHAGAAPGGVLCITGWKELLSKSSKGTCASSLSSTYHPKPTYKWSFNAFPFDISEINAWIFHFERKCNLEIELNFPYEGMQNNNNSWKGTNIFSQPEITSSYGLTFFDSFWGYKKDKCFIQLAWNTVVQISQWFFKKRSKCIQPLCAGVCLEALRTCHLVSSVILVFKDLSLIQWLEVQWHHLWVSAVFVCQGGAHRYYTRT